MIDNRNISDSEVNKLTLDIFYDYLDRDVVGVVIKIFEKMIEVRLDNEAIIIKIFLRK